MKKQQKRKRKYTRKAEVAVQVVIDPVIVECRKMAKDLSTDNLDRLLVENGIATSRNLRQREQLMKAINDNKAEGETLDKQFKTINTIVGSRN